MSTFFAFWPDVPKTMIFSWFGLKHIAAMTLTFLLVAFAIKKIKTVSLTKQKAIIQVCAILIVISELLRIVWLVSLGENQWYKLLPLHLCGTQIFMIPLAVFTKNKVLQDYTYCTAIIGGIVAILYPIGIVDTYPLFHFQTIQSLFLHALLIFVPIANIVCFKHKPNFDHLPAILALIVLIASIAYVIDFSFGQNYMFLLTVPPHTPLVWIYDQFGYLGYYLSMFAGMTLLCVIMLLPFKKKRSYFL